MSTFRECAMQRHAQRNRDMLPHWPEGSYFIGEPDERGVRYMHMILPAQGGRAYCSIPIQENGKPDQAVYGPSWQWDGNWEQPTLTPSIFNCPSNPEHPDHWHGWVRAGRMVSA